MSFSDKIRHKSIEKCEKKSCYMSPIHIGISHDYYLVISKLFYFEVLDLSFLTLRQESCPNYPELDGQDYIVLNSVSNVNKALYPLGSYERIHCFFDNDHAGMEALRQIRKEYGRDLYIRDASQTYNGCKDLNEYLQKQVERKRQVRSVKETRSQSPKKKNGFQL